MAGSVRTKEPDFSAGPTAASPLEVRVGAPEFEIEGVTGTVYYRLRLDQGPWKQLEENTLFQSRDGSEFAFLYLHSEGATGADVDLAIREDFCKYVRSQPAVEVTGTVSTQTVTGREPARLAGALSTGTVVTAGQEASEEIDVSDLDTLRVRAQVGGIQSLTSYDAAPRDGAVDVYAYETAAGDARLASVDAAGTTIRIYDATDPAHLVELGAFTGSTGTAWRAVAVDADDEVAVVLAGDSGTTSSRLITIDVSDPTGMSELGALEYDDDNVGTASQRGVAIDAGRDHVVFAHSPDQAIVVADYSDPANPTANAHSPSGLQLQADEGPVVLIHGLALLPHSSGQEVNVYAWRYTSGDPAFVGVQTFSGVSYGGSQGVTLDAERELLVVNAVSRWLVADASDPTDLVALFEGDLPNTGAGNLHAPYVAYDPDRQLVYSMGTHDVAGNDVLDVSVVDLADPEALEVIAGQVPVSSGNPGSFIYVQPDYHTAVGAPIFPDLGDDTLGSLAVHLGRDELRVFYLDPTGARVSAGNPTPATLEDGREAVVEADVVGEHAVELEIAARSAQDATIDHVDVYPEER